MSDVLNIVSFIIGVVSLVLAILAVPGGYLERRAKRRATAWPDTGYSFGGRHTPTPPAPFAPAVAVPPAYFTGQNQPPLDSPAVTPPRVDSLPSWRLFGYGLVGGAGYAFLSVTLFHSPGQRLIAALVTLAVTVVTVSSMRRRVVEPGLLSSGVVCAALGASGGAVFSPFVGTEPPKNVPIVVTVIIVLGATLIIVDLLRYYRAS